MTLIIQLIIIATAIFVIRTALVKYNSHAVRAYKKIGLIVLAVIMIVAVIFPNTTNDIAHAAGVGRGADLLLYLTVVAFIVYVLNNYLHQQGQHQTLVRLARRIAVLEAKEANKNKDS